MGFVKTLTAEQMTSNASLIERATRELKDNFQPSEDLDNGAILVAMTPEKVDEGGTHLAGAITIIGNKNALIKILVDSMDKSPELTEIVSTAFKVKYSKDSNPLLKHLYDLMNGGKFGLRVEDLMKESPKTETTPEKSEPTEKAEPAPEVAK